MCTVTFVPSNCGYTLSFNRDESPSRESLPPQYYFFNEKKLLFPKDLKGGGTWIAINEQLDLSCLLNGAFEKHERKATYPSSRGNVVLESFAFDDIYTFCSRYDFQKFEAFTLICIRNQQPYEIRWDERELHFNVLDPSEPFIHSSVTLYDTRIRGIRERWFRKWLVRNRGYTDCRMEAFHLTSHTGNSHYNIVMHRPRVATTSFIQFKRNFTSGELVYKDLTNKHHNNSVNLKLNIA